MNKQSDFQEEDGNKVQSSATARPLRVTVAGGGPVGLLFALSLKSLMNSAVSVVMYDGRWMRSDEDISWKTTEQGNSRRQQTVTLQSRQYSKLPVNVQKTLFGNDASWTEMWPPGQDSPEEMGPPRNIRISQIEDALLNEANNSDILLNPTNFDPETVDFSDQHVLVICDGPNSRTRENFIEKFGEASIGMYSVDGEHLEDTVLGLRVKSNLDESTSVLLTISQNRFLLNSLNGEGFLNMRLTSEEAREVMGIHPETQEFVDCIQSHPCLMARPAAQKGGKSKPNSFVCPTHGSSFKPALDNTSFLWSRIKEGLKLYDIPLENLTGITAFRLSMVHRPRFTVKILPPTASTPGTYACLIGDAANAIHFWPGRGLNSGITSAVSLARSLSNNWNGRTLREADFSRHEAMMHMIQYRQKSRAWRAMVYLDENGEEQSISSKIRSALSERDFDEKSSRSEFKEKIISFRDRLGTRIHAPPSDAQISKIVDGIDARTVHVLNKSDPWNTQAMAGEEIDLDIFSRDVDLSAGSEPKKEEIQPEPEKVIVKVPVVHKPSFVYRVISAAAIVYIPVSIFALYSERFREFAFNAWQSIW